MGMVLIGLFVLIDVLTERYSPGFAGRPAMFRVTRSALGEAAWLISLLFCAVAGFPLLNDSTRWVPLFVVSCVCASLILVAVVVYKSMQVPAAVASASYHTTEDRFWKGGLIYYNPADSAVMVP